LVGCPEHAVDVQTTMMITIEDTGLVLVLVLAHHAGGRDQDQGRDRDQGIDTTDPAIGGTGAEVEAGTGVEVLVETGATEVVVTAKAESENGKEIGLPEREMRKKASVIVPNA